MKIAFAGENNIALPDRIHLAVYCKLACAGLDIGYFMTKLDMLADMVPRFRAQISYLIQEKRA